MAKTTHPAVTCGALLTELRGLIDTARQHVAQTANATLTMLYWRIGLRIGVELLQKERAPYGQEIVSAVSRELTLAYGKGFTDRNLWHMKRFAEAFPDEQIVSTPTPGNCSRGHERPQRYSVETKPLWALMQLRPRCLALYSAASAAATSAAGLPPAWG